MRRRFHPALVPQLREAACLAWVRDLPPDELLRRMGGAAPFPPRTLAELEGMLVGQARVLGSGGVPGGGVADGVGGTWTLLAEPNGFRGTRAGRLTTISAGTDAFSVFWNADGLAELSVVRGGKVRAVLTDLGDWVPGDDDEPASEIDDVEGDPSEVADLVALLASAEGFAWEPVVFSWIERRLGIALSEGWFKAPHPSTTFVA
jgi:hypothetical protein